MSSNGLIGYQLYVPGLIYYVFGLKLSQHQPKNDLVFWGLGHATARV